MAARGEVFTIVPVGYVRTEDRRCEKDPDRQVQEAIGLMFRKFQEVGTARQSLLWFREEGIRLPVRPAVKGRPLQWVLPTYSRILQFLRNPIYAGAYAFGRHRTTTKMVDGRARRVTRRVQDPSNWRVLLKEHHEGYISWEEYMRNQDQLASNLPGWQTTRPGAAKGGPALLGGLLRCARCGRKLLVGYGGDGTYPRYHCKARKQAHGNGGCFTIGGVRVQDAVVACVLEALAPEGILASMDAVAQAQTAQDGERRALELALERASYETERCRRQHDSCEPENRLVSAELETRWERALGAQRDLEQRIEEFDTRQQPVTEEQLGRIQALGQDLPRLWDDAACPNSLKKRVLRAVLEEIIVDRTS
ncbi:MAG: recombinase family protein, partial [Lentisphaeria bacterium]|nr:recombinase family protein [Lentisphaeria bacterium]